MLARGETKNRSTWEIQKEDPLTSEGRGSASGKGFVQRAQKPSWLIKLGENRIMSEQNSVEGSKERAEMGLRG